MSTLLGDRYLLGESHRWNTYCDRVGSSENHQIGIPVVGLGAAGNHEMRDS